MDKSLQQMDGVDVEALSGTTLPAAVQPTMTVADIRELAALCIVAKRPDALVQFIQQDFSLAQARRELIDRRAALDSIEISSVFTGEAGTNPSGEGADRLIKAAHRLMRTGSTK